MSRYIIGFFCGGAKISGIDLGMRLVILGGNLSEQLFFFFSFFFFFLGGGGGGGGGGGVYSRCWSLAAYLEK